MKPADPIGAAIAASQQPTNARFTVQLETGKPIELVLPLDMNEVDLAFAFLALHQAMLQLAVNRAVQAPTPAPRPMLYLPNH